MRKTMAIANALADESRARALMALRNGELCVCQLVELLQLAPSTVSKHMSVLRDADLVQGRKHGRWMYYAPCPHPDSQAGYALAWLHRSLHADPQVAADAKRLKRILLIRKETLCRRQMRQVNDSKGNKNARA